MKKEKENQKDEFKVRKKNINVHIVCWRARVPICRIPASAA